MSKAEEKAREYAIKKHGDELIFHESYLETLGDFKAGYTQAEQDLSSQLTAYKEALRGSIQALTDISDPIEYLRKQMPKEGYKFDLRGAVEFSNNGMSVSGMAKDALSRLLTKAKTLIE